MLLLQPLQGGGRRERERDAVTVTATTINKKATINYFENNGKGGRDKEKDDAVVTINKIKQQSTIFRMTEKEKERDTAAVAAK